VDGEDSSAQVKVTDDFADLARRVRPRHALCSPPPARFVCDHSPASTARRGCLAAAGAFSCAHRRAG
jgi:hypothetical protein